MQLPRGKFRSVIKGVALNSLIQELAEVRYTGDITITWKQGAISLVIQKGRYILAEYGPLQGNAAWEGMIALGETIVDAILSDFSDSELKLAVEFNESCLLSAPVVPRVLKGPREKARETVTAPPETIREKAKEPGPVETIREKAKEPGPVETIREKVKEPGLPETSPELPVTPPVPLPPGPAPVAEESPVPEAPPAALPTGGPKAWTPVDMAQAIAVSLDKGGGEIPPPGGYDELALLHMEMSALDDVDVEHIATKIRKNARGIVKKLHLGHLMTEKEE
jgi:hypothetical protein